MTDDEYKRIGGPVSLGDAIAVAGPELPLLGYSPEWWEERDRVIAEERAIDAVQEEQRRMNERANLLRDEEFPELALVAALAPLEETTAVQIARRFVQARAHGLRTRVLVFGGGVGVGKTTAAAWICVKAQDPRPGFIRVSALERRGRYDKGLDAWLRTRTSLVIDDVGAEVLDGKGVFRSLLDEIVDTFYANKRTLIMTTNLRPKQATPNDQPQFKERYGERVWSRCSELGEWGDCGMRDLRKEQRA